MNKDIGNLKQIAAVYEKDEDEESALTNIDFTQEVDGVLPPDEIDGHLNLSQYCVSSDADTDKMDSDGEPPSLASLIGVASVSKRKSEGGDDQIEDIKGNDEISNIKRIKLVGRLDGPESLSGNAESDKLEGTGMQINGTSIAVSGEGSPVTAKVEDSAVATMVENVKAREPEKPLEDLVQDDQRQEQVISPSQTQQQELQQSQIETDGNNGTKTEAEAEAEDRAQNVQKLKGHTDENHGCTVNQDTTPTVPDQLTEEDDEEVEDVEDMEDSEDLDDDGDIDNDKERGTTGKMGNEEDANGENSADSTNMNEQVSASGKAETDDTTTTKTTTTTTTTTTTNATPPVIDPEQQRLNALSDITEIEYEFAELRQKLYENRLLRLELELQMCLEGSHPELRLYYEKIAAIRDYKLRRTYQKQKYELECIDKETRATRTYIHQNFYKQVNDIKNKLLGDTTQRWYEINRERRAMDVTVPDVNYHIPVKLAGKTLSCITGYAGPAKQSLPGEPISEDFAHEGIDFHYSSNPVDKLEVIVDRMRLNNEISDLEGLRKYFHGFPGAPNLNGLRDSEISNDLEVLHQQQQQQRQQQQRGKK